MRREVTVFGKVPSATVRQVDSKGGPTGVVKGFLYVFKKETTLTPSVRVTRVGLEGVTAALRAQLVNIKGGRILTFRRP